MGDKNLGQTQRHIAIMQKLLVVALVVSVIALVSSQGPERCGVFGDCICRDLCECDIEREGTLTECSNPNDRCCCAEETCGVFDDCACRSSCEGDERESALDECDTAGLTCCCQN